MIITLLIIIKTTAVEAAEEKIDLLHPARDQQYHRISVSQTEKMKLDQTDLTTVALIIIPDHCFSLNRKKRFLKKMKARSLACTYEKLAKWC